MVKVNDRVKTLGEKDGFPAGVVGVVVSLCGGGQGCEVELWNENEYPVDVVTYSADDLEVVL